MLAKPDILSSTVVQNLQFVRESYVVTVGGAPDLCIVGPCGRERF